MQRSMIDADNSRSEALEVLGSQSGVAAVLAGCVGAVTAAMLWKIATLLVPGNSGVLALATGVVVALFVRLIGRGITLRFRLIACFFVFVSTFMSLYLIKFRIADPFFLLWLTGGMGLAFFTGARSLPPDTGKQVWREITVENFREPGMGGSPIALIALSLMGSLACFIAIVVLAETTGITNYADTVSAEERIDRGEAAFEKGWNVGQYFTVEDCQQYVREREDSCSKNVACEAESPFILEGCVEAARQRGETPE